MTKPTEPLKGSAAASSEQEDLSGPRQDFERGVYEKADAEDMQDDGHVAVATSSGKPT
jgi:hypothetical protein